MPQSKTLEQVIEEYGVEDRPDGMYIAAIDRTVQLPPEGWDLAMTIDSIVRAHRRAKPRRRPPEARGAAN